MKPDFDYNKKNFFLFQWKHDSHVLCSNILKIGQGKGKHKMNMHKFIYKNIK